RVDGETDREECRRQASLARLGGRLPTGRLRQRRGRHSLPELDRLRLGRGFGGRRARSQVGKRLEPKVLEQTRPDLSAQLGIHQYELWADRLQHDVCLEMTVLRGSP